MGEKKILLIEPPFYRLIKSTYALTRYPLSLGYLASAVRAHTDWDVLVYNADFSPAADPFEINYMTGEGFSRYLENLHDPTAQIWREVRECITEYAAPVVGISAKSSTFASARVVAAIAKQIDSRTIVVLGGPHPSALGARILSCPHIDVGVVGEGEMTLVDLLRSLDRGRSGRKWNPMEMQVDGSVVRGAGGTAASPKREPISDLDSLGFPARLACDVLKDYDRYPKEAFRSVFATRGCPNNCLFCGSRNVWGRNVRFRSPRNVAMEIRGLQEMGLHHIHFDDDTFGVHAKYLSALCGELTEQCPGLRWSCEIHVGLVSRENISIMKRAGCRTIQLGIESGNDFILHENRKGYTIEEALRACGIIREHGIELETFFMAGLPQETEETLRDTLRAIEMVDCHKVVYSIFTPYPGTEAFDLCSEKGLVGSGHDPSMYYHQSPANCFCGAMSPALFRSIASRIEQVVDEKNRRGRDKRRKDSNDGADHQAHPHLHP